MELCGVSVPDGLDGNSFTKLLADPKERSWHEAAYSYFNNGVSVRVPQYRLTRYRDKTKYISELYDYHVDDMERKNTFECAEKEFVKKLIDVWEKGVCPEKGELPE